MRVLLDTNAYSALIAGQHEVGERIREAEEVLFSTIVLGELLFGFHSGSRYERNRRLLDEFLQEPRVRIVTLSLVTAERFGEIWIAAQAMENDSELLSADSHFGFVENLSWLSFPAR